MLEKIRVFFLTRTSDIFFWSCIGLLLLGLLQLSTVARIFHDLALAGAAIGAIYFYKRGDTASANADDTPPDQDGESSGTPDGTNNE